MATRNEQFFIDLGKGASWAAGVAFQRSNPLPLDKYSVFETEAKAIEYATTSAVAYPGQIVAYVDGDKMAVCVLAQNTDGSGLELQSIGGAIGDYETAAADTLPQKKAIYDEAGENVIGYEVKWVPISAIVEGDGNTTYTFAKKVEDEKTIVITPYNEGVAGEATEISLGFLTEDEINDAIDAKVGTPVDGETAATGLYALIAAEQARAEAAEAALETKIGKAAEGDNAATGLYLAIANALAEAKQYADDNDANDNTTYSISYGEYEVAEGVTKKAIKLAGSDNSASYVDVADFLKDSVLENVDYDADSNTLTFTWNTLDEDGNKVTTEVVLDDMLSPYTAGNGIDITGQSVAVKLDATGENFLTVSENGVKLAGVQDAIDAAEGRAAADATSKAGTAKAEAIADAEGKLATAVGTLNDSIDLKANAEDVYAKTETYNKTEVEGLVDGAKTAASTAVEGVQKDLNDYKTSNDAAVKANTDKLATVAEGAQVNVIEAVKVDNVALEITDKTVNINLAGAISNFATKDELKATDDKAVANAAKISTNETNIGSLQGTVSAQGEKITALETYKSEHDQLYAELKGTVDGHTNAIAGKAAQTDLEALATRVGAAEGTITTHGTDIEALKTSVGNVYTKTEADLLINAKADQTAFTELANKVNDTTTGLDTKAAAADLKKLEDVVNAEDTGLASKASQSDLTALTTRVKANEDAKADHEERIAEMETFWAAADDPEGTIDKLAEIVSYIESDKTGALDMAADIKANTDAIAAINDEETGIEAVAKKYTDDQIDAIGLAGEEKGLAITNAVENGVAFAEGKGTVNSLNVDKLVQTTGEYLILNGGSASINI